MIIAKAIATFFATLVIVKVYDEFRHGRENIIMLFFWLATWSTVLTLAFLPGITFWLRENIFGPDTGLGTIFGIGLIFLLFISYRLYIKADRAERKINKTVTELALKDLDKD